MEQLLGGDQLMALMSLRRRAWEKDYFTSALPWLQRGPEVTVPVQGAGSSMDVVYERQSDSQKWVDSSGREFENGRAYDITMARANDPNSALMIAVNGGTNNRAPELDPNGTLKVNVDEMGININDLRTSNALQRWFERNARGGSRYIEQILSHFGVRSSDARLQRPQFLGGGRMPISVSEVLQTSSTDETSPQANMAGHGISAGINNGFKHYFEEHGYIIGIMSITPRSGYQQGVPRDLRSLITWISISRNLPICQNRKLRIKNCLYLKMRLTIMVRLVILRVMLNISIILRKLMAISVVIFHFGI